MSSPAPDYIPAAGHDRFLRFYDPLTRLLGAERVRARLLDAARIQPGEEVLDLGCGTGALALQLLAREPGARVTGLDPDPKALALARQKARAAGVEIAWCEGYAGRAPFPAQSFDRVVSSLMIHHLRSEEKRDASRDVRRLLRPGGTFHLLDFGPAKGVLERGLTAVFHRDERIADNLGGRLPEWLRAAGFEDVCEVESQRTLFGRVALYSARAPR
jgi:ubiquinone/menaquinone biosynthesis C-methylase UbiE